MVTTFQLQDVLGSPIQVGDVVARTSTGYPSFGVVESIKVIPGIPSHHIPTYHIDRCQIVIRMCLGNNNKDGRGRRVSFIPGRSRQLYRLSLPTPNPHTELM